MTIKTQRFIARARKIAKKDAIKEAQKLFPLVLEAYPLNQQTKRRPKAFQQR